jgi:hypothetical protein
VLQQWLRVSRVHAGQCLLHYLDTRTCHPPLPTSCVQIKDTVYHFRVHKKLVYVKREVCALTATVEELRRLVSDLAASLERESAARQAAELRADQAEEQCRGRGMMAAVMPAPVSHSSSLSSRRSLSGAFAAAASYAPIPGSQCDDNDDKDQEPAVATAQASTTAAAGGTSTTSCTASPVVSYSCSEGVSGQETQQVSDSQQEEEERAPTQSGQAQAPSVLLGGARMSMDASSPVRPPLAHVSCSPTRCSPHPALKLVSAPSGMPAAEAHSPCVVRHSAAPVTPAPSACSASPTPEPQQPTVAAAGLSHVSPHWRVGGQVHFNLRVSYISSPGAMERTSPAQLLGSDLMGLLGH